ncbi:AMP dependent coa ligase [Nesidiocoris tenuis]|uniref:AMP dependent coa ligase n=1 Tax=Nesidiocoris tenuis TaxID=355587 RepID=A0ABN7A8F3_9HEMI|nr:AMP dependent coa ligase [Nesidiocoris tenuis]
MPIGGKLESDERIAHSQDLPTLVFENMKKFSDRNFLTDGLTGARLTFQEAFDEALSIAVRLRAIGVKEGSYVAFLTDSTLEACTFLIAVWFAGGCVSPINSNLSTDDIGQILDITTAEYVFCEGTKLPLFEEAKKLVKRPLQVITDVKHATYLSYQDLKSDDGSNFAPDAYDADSHVAFLLFTSGTTGVPKGVMLSSLGCLVNGIRIFDDFSSTLLTSPFYWISAAATFVNALLQGTELIIPRVKFIPGTKQPDLRHILRTIEVYKPKKWMSSPSTLLEMSSIPDVGKYDLSSLKHVSVGGSPILPVQKKYLCDTLFKGRNIIQERYGCSEAGFFTRQWKTPPPDFNDKKSASVGPPAPGLEVKIVDVETGRELGPNEVGEIFVRGSGNMIGYINKDLTERYTKQDWYRVGDQCLYDEDEWIYFKTRVKEMIKFRGHAMAPVDMENVVIQHPDVVEACVIGKPHPTDWEHPVAFVVKKVGSNLTEDALAAFVNGQVSDEKRLRGGVIFRDELPKSAIGKILRNKLQEEFQ